MNMIQTSGMTSNEGTLTLTLTLGKPLTRFDVAVVVNPSDPATGATPVPVDPWARITAFRERLAATGRDFGDSVQDIREDRDR